MTRTDTSRRDVLRLLAATPFTFLVPSCTEDVAPSESVSTGDEASAMPSTLSSARDPLVVPTERPADWDAVAFNTARANAGAAPATYLASINGPDGGTAHVGKHLPFVPAPEGYAVPAGMLPLMWGDPSKGHARHPNAVRSDANQQQGHWYDRIELSLAREGAGHGRLSRYPEWPGELSAGFAVQGGGAITDEDGKKTVYLAALPEGAGPGDVVRVVAHCLTHGEYVDFVTVPG